MSLIPSPPRTIPKLTRCLLSASHSPLTRQQPPLTSREHHLTRKLAPSRNLTTSTPRLSDLSPAPHFTMASTPSVPKTMNGIQIPRTGDVSVLTHETALPVPAPSDGQVLVRNEYAGINYIDTYFRTGLYKAPLPQVLGREGAGTVVSAHPSVSSSFSPGDRVVYMGPYSSYATYSAVPASSLLRIPDALGTDAAAAALLQGLTAWTFIREAGVVQKGEWVLVHAAAGGVGLQLVQMLRAVGAKVIGTTSSDEKCALAKKNGAEWIVNSKSQDLVAEVKKITDGHGVDVIFDGVGKATFDSDLEMAARKGRLVVFGNAVSLLGQFDGGECGC